MLKKMPYLVAVTFLGVYPMADTYVLIPAMTEIAQAMPGVGRTVINFILTIPSLMTIPASIVAGRMVASGCLTKKGCILLGSAIFTLGGLAGGLVVNIGYLLFTRAILGIGNGLVTAMVVAVAIDYFTDRETASVMGIFSAASNILAIGLTVISGYLVLVNWRYCFAVYLVGWLMIIYNARVLKKNPTRPLDEDEPAESSASGVREPERTPGSQSGDRLGRTFFALLLVAIVIKCLGNTMYLALSYFVEGQGLGNAAGTGLANGIMTVAIGVSGFAFGLVYGRLKAWTAIVFFLTMGAGNLLLAQSFTFTAAVAALVVWALGQGLTVPYLLRETIARSPRHLVTFSGALINSVIYVAFVLSTFVQPAVAWAMNTGDLRVFYNVVGLGLIISGLVAAGFNVFNRKAGGK